MPRKSCINNSKLEWYLKTDKKKATIVCLNQYSEAGFLKILNSQNTQFRNNPENCLQRLSADVKSCCW